MKYLENALKITVRLEKWKNVDFFPYFLFNKYHFEHAYLDNVEALFVYPKQRVTDFAGLKSDMWLILKAAHIPAVLCSNGLPSRQRHALIELGIPFVIDEKQIYLPFMGIALQAKGATETSPKKHFTPATQLLFLYVMYSKTELKTMRKIAQALNLSAMTVSRAAHQLMAHDLISLDARGKSVLISVCENRKYLWDKALPLLSSPVKKTQYIDVSLINSDFCMAGISALTHNSFLAETKQKTYAIANNYKQNFESSSLLLDRKKQALLEIWSYDPRVLAQDGVVDTLSLALSLGQSQDARTEDAVNEMLEEFWGNVS